MSFLLVLKTAMCWTRSGEPKHMPSIHRCCSWRLLFILGTHMQSPRLVHTTSTRIPKVQLARLFVKHTHTTTIKILLPEMKLCCHDFICFYISFRRRQPCVGLVDQKVCQASFFCISSTSDCLSLILGMHICTQVRMSAIKRTTLCQNTVAGAAAGQLNDCPCPTLPDSNTASKSTSHGVMAVGYC